MKNQKLKEIIGTFRYGLVNKFGSDLNFESVCEEGFKIFDALLQHEIVSGGILSNSLLYIQPNALKTFHYKGQSITYYKYSTSKYTSRVFNVYDDFVRGFEHFLPKDIDIKGFRDLMAKMAYRYLPDYVSFFLVHESGILKNFSKRDILDMLDKNLSVLMQTHDNRLRIETVQNLRPDLSGAYLKNYHDFRWKGRSNFYIMVVFDHSLHFDDVS